MNVRFSKSYPDKIKLVNFCGGLLKKKGNNSIGEIYRNSCDGEVFQN